MFTDNELKVLKWALSEIRDWLEEDDWEDFESICEKLDIETLDD